MILLPGFRTVPGLNVRGKRVCKAWTAAEDAFVLQNHAAMTCKQMAEALGRTASQVRNRCWLKKLPALVLQQHPRAWGEAEIERLCAAYANLVASECLDLQALADIFGRDKANVCRKARDLGLTNQRRPKLLEPKGPPAPIFATKQERSAATGERIKAYIAANGHPRGSLGMKHTPETKAALSAAGLAHWNSLSEDQQGDHILKVVKAKRASGVGFANPRGSWKAAWREIGGQRCFFRSRWEANYARYLEWLRSIGQIVSWEHEPHTFWFEGIKRGCVSYLPDFRVTNPGGSIEWHEVKGWMDARSKTTIARMAKYHPKEKLIVIGDKQYREIRAKVSSLIPGWES